MAAGQKGGAKIINGMGAKKKSELASRYVQITGSMSRGYGVCPCFFSTISILQGTAVQDTY